MIKLCLTWKANESDEIVSNRFLLTNQQTNIYQIIW